MIDIRFVPDTALIAERWRSAGIERVINGQRDAFLAGYRTMPVTTNTPAEWVGTGHARDRKCKLYVNGRSRDGYTDPIHLRHPDNSTSHIIGTNGLIVAPTNDRLLSVQHTYCALLDIAADHSATGEVRIAHHIYAANGTQLFDNTMRTITGLRHSGFTIHSGKLYRWSPVPEEAAELRESLAPAEARAEVPLEPELLLCDRDDISDYDIELSPDGFAITHVAYIPDSIHAIRHL